MKPQFLFLAAAGCLALWFVLAFVVQIPNGWAHVPLAVGASLVAVAIIELPPKQS